MANVCITMPKKGEGQALFNNLKKEFGYQRAWELWSLSQSNSLMHGKTFTRDSEGYPVMGEFLEDSDVKMFLSNEDITHLLGKKFPVVSNTRSNYEDLVSQANDFNNQPENKDYIAIVDYYNGDMLKVKVQKRNSENERKAIEQYGTIMLNNQIANILSPAGITIDDITAAERAAGRVGITDFTKANNLANDAIHVIRVANDREGSQAIGEEFSHLVIGAYYNEPLIQRALNSIMNESTLMAILGDEYRDTVDFQNGDMRLVAEEALGKILRENLLAESLGGPEEGNKVIERLLKYVRNKFKGIDETQIVRAINEANSLMGQFAKDLLNKNLELTQERVKQSRRDAQFNALSDRIDTNIEILKKLKDVEVKRLKITNYSRMSNGAEAQAKQTKKVNELIVLSNATLTEDEKKLRIGIYNYAKNAIAELQAVEKSLTNNTSFGNIRRARSYVQSYAGFLQDLRDAIQQSKEDEENIDYLTDIQLPDGTVVSMQDVLDDLTTISNEVVTRYARLARNKLIEFMKPAFGEIQVDGKPIDVEAVIRQAEADISFSDMFFDTMSASSDTYLQALGKITKDRMDRARETTIDDTRRIQLLMQYADKHGITTFNWMFEKDSKGNKSGNYISKINQALFDEEKAALMKRLDEKYGKNPKGPNARAKINEYREWIKENASADDANIPKDIEKYHSKEWQAIQNDPVKKYILDEFLAIKREADDLYPSNRVSTNKAIQMRKSRSNRIIESVMHPTRIVDNLRESIKNDFLDSQDDDSMFGVTRKGMTNFDNTEYMTLPVLYTNRLKDPNEITEDVFGSLMAYKYSANVYHQMESIVDSIEVARFWVTDGYRKTLQTRGDNKLTETMQVAGHTITNKIYKASTQIEAKLNEFVESQIYHRYIKDEGTIGKINVAKAGNWFMKLSSAAQLSFNWLTNSANVVTGLAMTNIEAAAGEYFTAKQLASADSAYFGLLPSMMAELGNRYKTNKLDLFNELFNIKQNYGKNIKGNQLQSILQKMFGETIAYLGQEAGDHWLYDRIAIAMAKNIKVRVPKAVKKVAKITGLKKAEEVLAKIIEDSEQLYLSEDESHYVNRQTGTESARVTSVLAADDSDLAFHETHEDGTPNNWITPSTNIGTGIDELIRDFFQGEFVKSGKNWHHNSGLEIDKAFPNAKKEQLTHLLDQLETLKAEFDRKGLTVTARDVVASGTIEITKNGKVKRLNVSGTIDLLLHDKQGNFYIYDIKTHRGKIDGQKRRKWAGQLSLYKQLLEQKYGIQVKGIAILPVKVTYPTPIGEYTAGEEGKVTYTESDNNQLLIDGHEFKGANPDLEEIIPMTEHKFNIDYADLGKNQRYIAEAEEKDTKIISLWDALEISDVFDGNSTIKKLGVPKDTTLADGSVLDLGLISRQMADVHIDTFGAYNEEDSNAANRIVLGRALMQMRKWIKPQFNRRFQKAQPNLITSKTKEGYYRTLVNVINEIRRGEVQLMELKEQLSPEEYANIKRALFELFQFFMCWAVLNLAPWGDDKKRPWLAKYLEYMANREFHELGMLTPSLTMVNEVSKTVREPFSCMSTMKSITALANSIITPTDWTDELQSGPYKGSSTLEKNIMKAPIPIVSWYKQVNRFTGEIDTSTQYYAKPW